MSRNGPGKFKVGGQEIGHPYDGDALITSVAFKDGRAFCRSRFVQTAEWALGVMGSAAAGGGSGGLAGPAAAGRGCNAQAV